MCIPCGAGLPMQASPSRLSPWAALWPRDGAPRMRPPPATRHASSSSSMPASRTGAAARASCRAGPRHRHSKGYQRGAALWRQLHQATQEGEMGRLLTPPPSVVQGPRVCEPGPGGRQQRRPGCLPGKGRPRRRRPDHPGLHPGGTCRQAVLIRRECRLPVCHVWPRRAGAASILARCASHAALSSPGAPAGAFHSLQTMRPASGSGGSRSSCCGGSCSCPAGVAGYWLGWMQGVLPCAARPRAACSVAAAWGSLLKASMSSHAGTSGNSTQAAEWRSSACLVPPCDAGRLWCSSTTTPGGSRGRPASSRACSTNHPQRRSWLSCRRWASKGVGLRIDGGERGAWI